MDTFAKYRDLKNQGATARQVYLTAKADGLDEIALIRLLRTTFGLSLREAKQVSNEADVFETKQEVRPGATVYWEGTDTVEGSYVMQAKVVGIEGDRALLEGHRKYRVTGHGLEEVRLAGDGPASIPLSYFDKTLAERLGQALQLWQGLSEGNGHPVQVPGAVHANESARPTR